MLVASDGQPEEAAQLGEAAAGVPDSSEVESEAAAEIMTTPVESAETIEPADLDPTVEAEVTEPVAVAASPDTVAEPAESAADPADGDTNESSLSAGAETEALVEEPATEGVAKRAAGAEATLETAGGRAVESGLAAGTSEPTTPAPFRPTLGEIEAGKLKGVACEKPLGRNVAEARRMLELAE